ncbi:MAG: phosphoglucomutase [Clostridiales bacterium]|nr:phosphoglucomutase [Clostridiales bacterium]
MSYKDEYKAWLKNFAADEGLVKELTAITDEKEIEDRFYTDLSFGTAGMRGVLGMGRNRMNIYTVRRASFGLADYLLKEGVAEQGVVIAFDSRNMSAEFAKEAALCLAARGVKAFLFDALRPVPVLSFAVRHLGTAAGIVITASHNPPQYNGYKVYAADGAQLGPEAADAVTVAIRSLSYFDLKPMEEKEAVEKGLLQIIGNREVDDDYIAMIKGLSLRPELLAEMGKDLSIVYTPLHGSGNVPVRRMLKELGVSHVAVVKEQELPDGNFPTVKAPNPEDPNAFTLAIPLADETGATVVFGTDPDCDRMGVAVRDREGVFHTLTGNQIGCLLLSHVLSSRKLKGTLPRNGAAVKSIVSTELSRAICKDYGVELFDVLTGFKFIGEKIQQFEETGEYQFLFGFEESFGFLSGTKVRDKDGVNASLLLCEAACAAAADGVTLYDRLQDLFKKYGYYVEKVISVTLPGIDGVQRMKDIMANLRKAPPQELAGMKVTAVRDYLAGTRTAGDAVETIDLPRSDVLYFELEGGNWLCVRPSGTEPKIKLYVNTRAADEEKAAVLNEQLKDAAKKLAE